MPKIAWWGIGEEEEGGGEAIEGSKVLEGLFVITFKAFWENHMTFQSWESVVL